VLSSKINGCHYEDLCFEKNEVPELKKECLYLKTITSNEIALSGLNKLIKPCEEAEKDNLAIYFLSN
jgi:hypothetical protein